MKSIFVLLIITLCFAPSFLIAQDSTRVVHPSSNKIRIALRTGVYLSRFKYNDLPSDYGKVKGDDAVYGGLQVDIPFSDKLSLAPEILYAISSSQSFDNTTKNLYQDELSQLLVPVLLKYKLGKVSLFLGPQAEFLLSAKGPYYVQSNNSIKFNQDIKDRSYKNFSLSGVVGAEWVFKYRFGIDARYQLGLTDFRASNGSTLLTSYGTIKANAFQAGIFFRFGKKPTKGA